VAHTLDDLKSLASTLRKRVPTRMWDAAVRHVRQGGVEGLSSDSDELALRVKSLSRPMWHQVFLWPADAEGDCDCDREGDCVHICAATLAMVRAFEDGQTLPEPRVEYKICVHYVFTSRGSTLCLERRARWPDGREIPITGNAKEQGLVMDRGDLQAQRLFTASGFVGGDLTPVLVRRLLAFLEGEAFATLDGEPITLKTDPILFRVRVSDEEEGFRVGLYRPSGIERLFRGAALVKGSLHPTSHGTLEEAQKRMLLRGVRFEADEVASLVGETLPRLSRRIPVDLHTTRLPRADALVPRVKLELVEHAAGLDVMTELVYGDPPVAKVTLNGELKALSDSVVPARDVHAERVAAQAFRDRTGRPVGVRWRLDPGQVAVFLRDTLPGHDGIVVGKVDASRYQVKENIVMPQIAVRSASDTSDGSPPEGWYLDVAFEAGGDQRADPMAVLDAWREGRGLVPLLEGGFAPLPVDWLAEHGPLLRELLEARDVEGKVHRQSTAALVELMEETHADVPPDLQKLRSFLEGGDGLPEVALPDTLKAELRPYQHAGFQWLRFLREMDLHGVLADDMGLGKTVQTIAAFCETPGPHLVVAPTSVLPNWVLEIQRFAPSLSVTMYHGPSRKLKDTDVLITSYAILRLDLPLLMERDWQYVVLDEAQAIKNPSSQTAKSACRIPGRYRVALTGTPVENRLEELWSLFRFLMPGFLGTRQTFRERFVRPIENGDPAARKRMRGRVRPYVLRRMKNQVASELPPLTELVLRCTLSAEQRKLYDGVRLAARQDVQAAMSKHGEKGATIQVLEALLRMRQACCDPMLLPADTGAGVPSAKLDRMEELLVDVVSEGHRVLVFSQWTSFLNRVEERLRGLSLDWVRLDGATKNRQKVIEQFQDPEGPPVFLLSLKAGGMGLNLTAADYVLHLDPWWNPAVERQATDRAYRIGQDRPVMSCKLIAADTVEEKILELQQAKLGLADAALGEEGGFVERLTADDLRRLFEES
jgi:hypothetical protein